MGKRAIKEENTGTATVEPKKTENPVSPKRRVESARLCVESTYNNTKLSLADLSGNVIASASSGSLGFTGAKKGTPFAAAKVGETLALKAQAVGVKEITVFVNGVGSGREAAIRGFVSRGAVIKSISDVTPIPHNGPKPPRPRRV